MLEVREGYVLGTTSHQGSAFFMPSGEKGEEVGGRRRRRMGSTTDTFTVMLPSGVKKGTNPRMPIPELTLSLLDQDGPL